MTDEEATREQGVEFGRLAEALDSHEFPTTNARVVEAFGDHEIGLTDGTTTVRAVLGEMGETTYESPAEVKRAILSMVGDEAIGREDYTDRGDETGERTDESF